MLFCSIGTPNQEPSAKNDQDLWEWSVEDNDKTLLHPNWLDECRLALSPTGELMAVTYRQNMVILICKSNIACL